MLRVVRIRSPTPCRGPLTVRLPLPVFSRGSADIRALPESKARDLCALTHAVVGLLRSAGFCSGQPGPQWFMPVFPFSVCDLRRVLKYGAR